MVSARPALEPACAWNAELPARCAGAGGWAKQGHTLSIPTCDACFSGEFSVFSFACRIFAFLGRAGEPEMGLGRDLPLSNLN
jgi:hypothetical protein